MNEISFESFLKKLKKYVIFTKCEITMKIFKLVETRNNF